MISALVGALVSMLVCLVATPLVRSLALRRGVVDAPGGRRVHKRITPRLGGVAICLGFFAPLLALYLFRTRAMHIFDVDPSHGLMGLVYGGTLVALVGAIDDVKGIGPWWKLLAQAAAAAIAFGYGYTIEGIWVPWVGKVELGIFSYVVTMAWFLAITNAINLIDGLDGLAGGIAFFACASNIYIAQMHGDIVVVLFSACLGGALLGFLRYNFNPASIFMGDSGSMFVGFVLAATSLAGARIKSSTTVAIVAPLVALGVPMFDTMLAMVRRTLARQSIFAADRGHIHHRLLDFGFTHRRAVLTLYAASIVLGLLAIEIVFERSVQLGATIVVAGLVAFILVRMARPAVLRGSPYLTVRPTEELMRLVRDATVTLARVDELAAIRRVLGQLAGSAGLARVDLLELVSGATLEPEDSGILRYEVVVGEQHYAVDFALAQAVEPELVTLLKLLSEAVREALERAAVRVEPAPRDARELKN